MDGNKIISRWQVVLIDEKEIGIQYPGILEKGKRPFVVIKIKCSYRKIICVPMIGKINDDGTTKDNVKNWPEYTFDKESFIITDNPILIDLYNDIDYVETTGTFVPRIISSKIKDDYKKWFK